MLHQKGLFDLAILTALSKARKARNDLAHNGVHPSENDANACYSGMRLLISIVLADDTLPLLRLNLANHALSDPFAPPKHGGRIEPEFWMPIPKLPGEEELEKAEAKFFATRDNIHRGSDTTIKSKRGLKEGKGGDSSSQLINARIKELGAPAGAGAKVRKSKKT
jgi:hypothetical protein